MQHIQDLLNKRVSQTGLSKNIKNALVIEEFNDLVKKIFGPQLSLKIKALYLKNNILTIASLSSVAAQELNFKKSEIIEQINHKFKEKTIKDLRFII